MCAQKGWRGGSSGKRLRCAREEELQSQGSLGKWKREKDERSVKEELWVLNVSSQIQWKTGTCRGMGPGFQYAGILAEAAVQFFPVGVSLRFFCHCTMAGLWSAHLGLLPEESNSLICHKSGIWDFCLKVVIPYFVIMGLSFFSL